MDVSAVTRALGGQRVQRALGVALAYTLLTVLGVVFAIPFLWMLSSSLKVEADVWLYPPKWIPNPIMWANYPEALEYMHFPRLLYNTLFITVTNMAGLLLSCSLVVYGFARFRFPGRNALFMVLLATMMLPGQVTMIPLFIVFKHLGWLNTYKPLIVPSFFGNAFYIFLLRQFVMTIPTELDDAAKIDGCSYVGIWWRIILPLSKPALATVAIFTFMGSWNDYLWPLICLNDMDKFTLALGLATFRGLYSTQWGYLMAASIVVLFPCVAIYFFAQQYFVEGITLSGLHG